MAEKNKQPASKASHDSEEDGAPATSSEIDASRDSNRLTSDGGQQTEVKNSDNLMTNGHLDPAQRRIYLLVFALACASETTGLILVIVWMFAFRPVSGVGFTDANKLANLHPLLMYLFMVSFNMYSVLAYRTHFHLPKEQLKLMHAVLSGGNIVMSLLGVFAMFKAHLMAGIPNFYSLHSWIGSMTNLFYLIQFVSGFVAFLKPGLRTQLRSNLMPWHRMAGAAILVLAAMSAITGMSELVIFQDKDKVYGQFAPITFIANFAGISVIVMTACTIYLVTAPQYLRPQQNEELPLKR